MWDKLTYQKKVLAIAGGFVLFLLLAYAIVFSRTIKLYKDIKVKNEKLVWLKEKEKEIPALQQQMTLLDKAYNASDSASIRDRLTAFISDYAEENDCMVTEIPENAFYASSKLNVQTNRFVVKGNFNDLLKLLNEVETEFNYSAKVVSAKFYSIVDLQTKKTNLFLSVITQSFREQTKTPN